MTRVRVGPVDIRTDIDLSPKEIRALLREAAGIALALGRADPDPPTLLGFTAHLERLPDEFPPEPGEDD